MFRRFLDRISAETCLKMNYFHSKSPKLPSAEGTPQDPFASGGWGRSVKWLENI